MFNVMTTVLLMQLASPLVAVNKADILLVSEQKRPELSLYYAPSCPFSKKVLSYLSNIHKTVPLTDVYKAPQAKEYLRTHGGRMQVPCLFVDGIPIYGAEAIIEWLSENKDSF